MNSIAGKKILFIITKSNWGGAQAYVYSLGTALQQKGALVTVALGGTGLPGASTGLLAERLNAAGVRVRTIPSFARDISVMLELKAFDELLKIVREEKPNIIHVNSSKAGGIGALAGRLIGVRHIVYTVHGWPHTEPRPFYARFLIWLGSWGTILLSTRVIVLSKLDYRRAPVFFSKRKLEIVSNGVTSIPFLTKEAARAHLISLGVQNKSTWLLMNAELHPNKGIDVVIEAFNKIKDKELDMVLVVMGEGQERSRLEALIAKYNLQDRVFLPGFIPDSRMYLRAASLFIMASRKEGMPMAILEAGMAELPIISTSVGAIPEMIKTGIDGLLIPRNDSHRLENAITSLLHEPAEAAALAASFHQKILTEYSEEKMVEETINVYLT